MNTLSLALLWMAALPAEAPNSAPAATQPILPHCRVSIIEKADLSASEGGALQKLDVRAGQIVKAGDEIGHIDDRKAEALRRVKLKEYEAARETADDDINVRFSQAAAGVAKLAWEKAFAADKQVNNSVSQLEIKKLELEYHKAKLQIEKSNLDQKIAKLTAEVKKAEVDAADAEIALRRIVSPLDGIIVKVHKHVGEWLQPGDPVVEIVRIDRLWVEGYVNAADFNPGEIDGRDVTVDAEMARGRKMRFKGQVVFVKPLVEGGDYLVQAEVENRQENGHWLLRPGLNATMTIQLK